MSVEVDRAKRVRAAGRRLLSALQRRPTGPTRRRASGFREIGLPFESDTAVTRHLAAFLQAQGDGRRSPVRPTHVLFNGGVFKAEPLRERLLDVLWRWFPDAAPKLLEGEHDLDHAVARGAAYYGWTKQRGGVRIRGGTARCVLRRHRDRRPGRARRPRPLRALCVVPMRHGRGHADRRPGERNRPDRRRAGPVPLLQFLDAQTRPARRHVDRWTDDELAETDSLEAALPADESIDEDYVPVRFQSRVTELGMLELWCAGTQTNRRWKLEFSVREE